jgi:hypothetical protein
MQDADTAVVEKQSLLDAKQPFVCTSLRLLARRKAKAKKPCLHWEIVRRK